MTAKSRSKPNHEERLPLTCATCDRYGDTKEYSTPKELAAHVKTHMPMQRPLPQRAASLQVNWSCDIK
jgi:hypothetical protein